MDTVRVGAAGKLIALGVLGLFGLGWPAAAVAGDEPRAAAEGDWQKQALALNDVTGEDPIKAEVKKFTSDPAAGRNLVSAAVPLAKEKSQPFNYNAAYILANVARGLNNAEAGEVFFRICADQAKKLKSANKLFDAYAGLIDLAYEHKKYAESEKLCKEFLETEAEDAPTRRFQFSVVSLLIKAQAKQGKIDEAMKLANNMVKAAASDTGKWLALEVKGGVEVEAGKTEDAVQTFEKVLDLVGKDAALKEDERADYSEAFRYRLSGLYADLGKIDKAAGQLKALLEKKPNDPTYNNDLGYIWADHDMNLAEAEKLIRRAIDEDRKERKARRNYDPAKDKDNAAYLDSMGWVLYKQKKYKEAKPYLEDAVKDKDGRHIEIFDHLGDVCLALGQKAEAVEAWKKAVESAGTSKREKDRKAQVEKKLKEHQGESGTSRAAKD